MDCIFCKIIKGELPSEKIYEDDKFVAILDINPVHEGHALVMPKEHTPNFLETPDEILKLLLPVCKKVAKAVVKSVQADGFNLSTNNGRAAHQQVDHLHFHIIPRYLEDGLKPWPQSEYKEDRIKEVGEKIRDNIKQ